MVLLASLCLGCYTMERPALRSPFDPPYQVTVPVHIEEVEVEVVREHDAVDHVTWIRAAHDTAHHILSLSAGLPDDEGRSPVLYLTATYQGVTPLGAQALTITADAQQLDLAGQFSFDVYYPEARGQLPVVTERIVTAIAAREVETLLKAKDVTVRFRGPEQFRQYDLPAADAKAMRAVLDALYNLAR